MDNRPEDMTLREFRRKRKRRKMILFFEQHKIFIGGITFSCLGLGAYFSQAFPNSNLIQSAEIRYEEPSAQRAVVHIEEQKHVRRWAGPFPVPTSS
jgi:hypothetical protein